MIPAVLVTAVAALQGELAPIPEVDHDPNLGFLVLGSWVLLLGIFVGFELITKVPPTLHTPLMSGANAISGITLVGALYCAGAGYSGASQWLGLFAIVFATVNVVGGFLVTDRMLSMFGTRSKGDGKGGSGTR